MGVLRRVAAGGAVVSVDPSQLIDMAWTSMGLLPWHWFALAAHVLLASLAVVHAMLFKRDPRAAPMRANSRACPCFVCTSAMNAAPTMQHEC